MTDADVVEDKLYKCDEEGNISIDYAFNIERNKNLYEYAKENEGAIGNYSREFLSRAWLGRADSNRYMGSIGTVSTDGINGQNREGDARRAGNRGVGVRDGERTSSATESEKLCDIEPGEEEVAGVQRENWSSGNALAWSRKGLWQKQSSCAMRRTHFAPDEESVAGVLQAIRMSGSVSVRRRIDFRQKGSGYAMRRKHLRTKERSPVMRRSRFFHAGSNSHTQDLSRPVIDLGSVRVPKKATD